MSNWISVTDKLPEPDQWVIYHAPGIFDSVEHAQMWIGKCDVRFNLTNISELKNERR